MNKKDLEILREIGIEKIKQDTKLDTARISDILEKRFERLDYVRAKGFIKILEREYKLDLSDWLEEYRLAVLPNKDDDVSKEEHKEDHVMPPLYKKNFDKKRLIALGAVGVLVIIALFVLLSKDSQQEKVEQIPEPALDLSTKESDVVMQEAEVKEKHQEEAQKIEDKSTALAPVATPAQSKIDANTPINELGVPLFEDLEINDSSVLKLTFENPVWVGIVDLESKKRNANTRAEYQIPLDQEKLFYIAYGKFSAMIEDAEEKFKSYEPAFLIYTKDGGLRKLTKDEYLFVNGGIEW